MILSCNFNNPFLPDSSSVELGQDPSCLLNKLKSYLEKNSLDVATCNVILILLSKLFEASPHSHYAQILELAVEMFNNDDVDGIVAGILVAPGIQILMS